MASPEIQNLAHRLLALEAAQDNSPGSDEEVALRVIEVMRLRLIRLAGVDGFRSLLSRALTLAQGEAPALGAMSVSSSGFLEGLGEAGRGEAAEKAKVVLIAHLLELLVTFIGESLTLHLVRDAWPGASIESVDTGTEDKS